MYNNFIFKLKNNVVKNSIIIILRGHIRQSFDNSKLYDYLLYLSEQYKLHIFIHTWNIKSNNISWKDIEEDTSIINKNVITDYFKNIKIEKIIIDDESNVDLIGNIVGNIKTTLMPIKGWKYMWYGMYRITNYLLNNIKRYNLNVNTYTLNIRFDYFTNSTINQYNLKNLSKLYNFKTSEIIFMKNLYNKNTMFGIDNIYFGHFYKIYYTVLLFHSNLDYILECFDTIIAQERLVYILQEYINNYTDNHFDDDDYIILTIKMILTKLRVNYIKSHDNKIEIKLNTKELQIYK